MTEHEQHHFRAMMLALLAFAIWTISDALIKLCGMSGVPMSHTVLLFSVSGAATIAAMAAWRGRANRLKPRRLAAETARGLILTVLGCANFIAFTNLPLTLTYTVIFFAPMPIALLAAAFMREHVTTRHWMATIIGFSGVLLAINPAEIDLNDGKLAGYIALPFCLVFYVANMLMTRLAGRSDDSSESMAFYPQTVRAAVLLPVMVAYYEPLQAWQWLCISGLGVLSGLGWLALSAAMKMAPVAMISPFQYSQVVIGGLIGYMVWGTVPSWHLVTGAAVIIASGIYMAKGGDRRTLRTRVG